MRYGTLWAQTVVENLRREYQGREAHRKYIEATATHEVRWYNGRVYHLGSYEDCARWIGPDRGFTIIARDTQA